LLVRKWANVYIQRILLPTELNSVRMKSKKHFDRALALPFKVYQDYFNKDIDLAAHKLAMTERLFKADITRTRELLVNIHVNNKH
jgi:hypothetical protein